MKGIIKEKKVFEIEEKGYHFIGTYLKEPKGDSLIEIYKNGKVVKEFLFPSYKIYNIPAHVDDIIDGLEHESDSGLRIAGSDELGGNCYVED